MIHFADQVTRGAASIRDPQLSQLKRHFSEQQIVELTATIAVANFTNRINDALLSHPDLGE